MTTLFKCLACGCTYEIPKEQESPLACSECLKIEEARRCLKGAGSK